MKMNNEKQKNILLRFFIIRLRYILVVTNGNQDNNNFSVGLNSANA